MTVIEVLEHARTCELEISVQLEHIERLHRIAARAQKSSDYSQRIMDKLENLEKALNEQIDRSVDAKEEALKYINTLTGEERAVIERYYILGETWEQISHKIYTSERRVYLLRKSALNKLTGGNNNDMG